LSLRNEAAEAFKDGSRIEFFPNCTKEIALMETTSAPETAPGETTLIGTSIVIKGELSCGEDLYIEGQVEGTIDPKENRLTIGPHGREAQDFGLQTNLYGTRMHHDSFLDREGI
jgi:hypothetical protein